MTQEQAAREFAQSLADRMAERGGWLRRSAPYRAIMAGDAWDLAYDITEDECFTANETDIAIAEAICEAVQAVPTP